MAGMRRYIKRQVKDADIDRAFDDVRVSLDSITENAGLQTVAASTPKASSGPTAARPTGVPTGQTFFDTTLGKPIWWNGKHWVDATGANV